MKLEAPRNSDPPPRGVRHYFEYDEHPYGWIACEEERDLDFPVRTTMTYESVTCRRCRRLLGLGPRPKKLTAPAASR